MESGKIARTLADGWDYIPEWRSAVVEKRLTELPDASVEQLCRGENDPVVRQALRFRRIGQCVASQAFRWAYNCEATRGTNSAASLLRALVIAGFTAEEIALQLGTSRINIVVAERLFFDVRRFRANRAWLASIAMPAAPANAANPLEARERVWMLAAIQRGRQGLEALLTNHPTKGRADLNGMLEEIRSVLVEKAHRFVLASLHDSPHPADLARLTHFLSAAPPQEKSAQEARMATLMQRATAAIFQKKEVKEPTLPDAQSELSLPHSSTESPRFSPS